MQRPHNKNTSKNLSNNYNNQNTNNKNTIKDQNCKNNQSQTKAWKKQSLNNKRQNLKT